MSKLKADAGRRGGKREADRLFQLGEFWLCVEEGRSDYIQYCWYDPVSRRRRRKTTGHRDLEAAKLWLINLVTQEPTDAPDDPDVVPFVRVQKFYFKHHADGIRSKSTAKRALELVDAYLIEKLSEQPRFDGAPKVGQFGVARQEDFMRWCRDRYQHSNKTVSIYLTYIKAAVRFCARPRVVRDRQGREREVQILSRAPFIQDDQASIQRVTGLSLSTPRDQVPSDIELARLIDRITPEHEHVFRYIVMQLNTWARPEAICQLSVKAQVNFAAGTLDLNAPGRPQNNKHRPLIKLTNNLRGWLLHWNLDYPIVYNGRPARKVDNRTLGKLAEAAGWSVPFMQYTLRHYMATRIRNVAGFPVPREERASWLGHADNENRTTEKWYESHDHDYLIAAASATDALLERLNGLLRKRTLLPPADVAGKVLDFPSQAYRSRPRKDS